MVNIFYHKGNSLNFYKKKSWIKLFCGAKKRIGFFSYCHKKFLML